MPDYSRHAQWKSNIKLEERGTHRLHSSVQHLHVIFFLHLLPQSIYEQYLRKLPNVHCIPRRRIMYISDDSGSKFSITAEIYLHFALRKSQFSAPRKVDKNRQRMVTNRFYSLTIDTKRGVSRRPFEQF